MTRRERFISAVSHRDTRPIPWTIELTVGETEKMRDFYKTDELDPILQSHVTKMNYPY